MPASVDPVVGTPWSGARLSSAEVPYVYTTVWRSAENRKRCALLAFRDTGAPGTLAAGKGANPRAATFAGGWGVAYDLPGQRSAFGVAGAGVKVEGDSSAPIYDAWPYHRTWSDGSRVGYGPEGGTGPNQLAYLRIPGQNCLYNVWSRLGVAHLEALLEQLRFVTVD